MVILENIDIDIDMAILQSIDIDKILNRFKFGISNRAIATSTTTTITARTVADVTTCALSTTAAIVASRGPTNGVTSDTVNLL